MTADDSELERMVDGVFDGAVDGGVSSVVVTHTTVAVCHFSRWLAR